MGSESKENEKKKGFSDEQLKVLGAAALLVFVVPMFVSLLLGFVVGWFTRFKVPVVWSRVAALFGGLASVGWAFVSGGDIWRWAWSLASSGGWQWSGFPFVAFLLVFTFAFGVTGWLGRGLLMRVAPSAAVKFDPGVEVDNGELMPTSQERSLASKAPMADKPRRSRQKKVAGEPPKVNVGVDKFGADVFLYEPDLGTHGQVLGSTGAGKTETLKRVMAGMLDIGWDLCVIDLKEDIGPGGLEPFLEAYAKTYAVPYQSWALSYPADQFEYYLNVLDRLTPDQAKNAVANVQEFDDGHWQAMSKMVLGQLVTLLYDAHTIDPQRFPTPTLREIGKILAGFKESPKSDPAIKERLAVVTSVLIRGSGQRSEDDYHTMVRPSRDHVQAANGLGARIGQVFQSEAGRSGLMPGPGRMALDVTAKGVTYIGLDQLGQEDTTRVLVASLLARFGGYASERQRNKANLRPMALVIDEAAAAHQGLLMNLLQRARSAKIAIVLATQSAKDWEDNWERIGQNTTWAMIHTQADVTSATMAAELLGTKVTTVESRSVRKVDRRETGAETVAFREQEDFVVPVEEVRQLPQGEAVLRVGRRWGATKAYIKWVKVKMRDQDVLMKGMATQAESRFEDKSSDMSDFVVDTHEVVNVDSALWNTPKE